MGHEPYVLAGVAIQRCSALFLPIQLDKQSHLGRDREKQWAEEAHEIRNARHCIPFMIRGLLNFTESATDPLPVEPNPARYLARPVRKATGSTPPNIIPIRMPVYDVPGWFGTLLLLFCFIFSLYAHHPASTPCPLVAYFRSCRSRKGRAGGNPERTRRHRLQNMGRLPHRHKRSVSALLNRRRPSQK